MHQLKHLDICTTHGADIVIAFFGRKAPPPAPPGAAYASVQLPGFPAMEQMHLAARGQRPLLTPVAPFWPLPVFAAPVVTKE